MTAKYFELEKDEEKTAKEFERGEWVRVPGMTAQRKRYQAAADATLSKTKNINIRVAEKDLNKIKSRAAEKGMPYQTLLASLIHQYSDGKIPDRLP